MALKLKTPIDADLRRRVMADIHAGMGPDEASRKHGVKSATIRTWKRRDKGNDEPAASQETAAFQMDPAQIPVEQLPDFGPADAPAPVDQPAAAPSAPPPAAPPPSPADAIVWAKLVSLASDGFQAVVTGQVEKADGKKPTSPQPPEPISKEDQKELSEALHAAFVAYGGNLAQFLAKWGPLINLTVVSGAIFLPRIMQAREYIKHQNAEKKRAAEERIALAAKVQPSILAQRIDEPETAFGDRLARLHAVTA